MKRMEVTVQKIGENTFYLRPFAAFTAANISGELVALFTPMLGSLAPLVPEAGAGKGDIAPEEGENAPVSIMDLDVDKALPALADAFSGLSGAKFERIMMKLLIDHGNISVESEATDWETKIMTRDIADEVFCGEVQDMFILCWYVIKLNFSGFFKKLGTRFGSLREAFQKVVPSSDAGENSITPDFPN